MFSGLFRSLVDRIVNLQNRMMAASQARRKVSRKLKLT